MNWEISGRNRSRYWQRCKQLPSSVVFSRLYFGCSRIGLIKIIRRSVSIPGMCAVFWTQGFRSTKQDCTLGRLNVSISGRSCKSLHAVSIVSIFLSLPSFIQRIRPEPRPFVLSESKLFFAVSCKPHAKPPRWRTIPCRLYATAYSVSSAKSCWILVFTFHIHSVALDSWR